MSVTQAVDGGYVVVSENGWIGRLNDDGQFSWQFDYNSPFDSISRVGNNGYVVAGGEDYPPWPLPYTGELVRMDANGEPQWMKNYIGGDFNWVIESEFGGFAVAGIYHNEQDDEYGFALRVNDEGEIVNCDIFDTVVPQAVATNVTELSTNKSSILSSFESHLSQPTDLPGNLEITRICPAPPSTNSEPNVADMGC
jgi:hypothetical protein